MTEQTFLDPITQGYYRQGESEISTTQSIDKILLQGDAFARHGPRFGKRTLVVLDLFVNWEKLAPPTFS